MKLTEKEKDLIEAIRNYKASKSRMTNPEEYEWYIQRLIAELTET